MSYLLIEPTERWLADVIRNHHEEALKRVSALLQNATETPEGCLVTPGPSRRKVRFRGHQTRAYRLIYAVTHSEVLTFDDVVRHRCHNGLCINPDHLEVGTRADNKHDDWEVAAYGVDFDML
ncbi:HNH endonuclease [Roseovarius lutimaris]|uniref:HNH endonuclease n=1 Tax=Roseovarius lutimaris TaxID=1005928 RepID=A0A1I5H4Q9_9RHOB|nr:HNH endonuclease [Roseovarius lutimaris]SFO43153.1 HNH endonuclease [Roseovarius lutimaris]